jgi:hypothetical protein
MTNDEFLASYQVVGFAIPKRGQLIKTTKNHGGDIDVVKLEKGFKKFYCTIVEKRS